MFGLVALLLCIRDGVMTPDVAEGLVLWVLLLYPVWSPRKWRLRKQRWQRKQERQHEHKQGAIPSTQPIRVSQMGPAWEQDAPYPEAFDEEEDL